MNRFRRIATVDELPEGAARAVSVAGCRLALFHLAHGFHATDATCALHGPPLERVTILEEQTLCSRHGVALDVATGRCAVAHGPVVRSYPLRIANGGVYLDLRDLRRQ